HRMGRGSAHRLPGPQGARRLPGRAAAQAVHRGEQGHLEEGAGVRLVASAVMASEKCRRGVARMNADKGKIRVHPRRSAAVFSTNDAGTVSAAARRRRYSARGISTAPRRAVWSLRHWMSKSWKPRWRSRSTRNASATLEASLTRLNI